MPQHLFASFAKGRKLLFTPARVPMEEKGHTQKVHKGSTLGSHSTFARNGFSFSEKETLLGGGLSSFFAPPLWQILMCVIPFVQPGKTA